MGTIEGERSRVRETGQMKAKHWVQLAKAAALALIVITALVVGYGEIPALIGGAGTILGSLLRSVRDADRNDKRALRSSTRSG